MNAGLSLLSRFTGRSFSNALRMVRAGSLLFGMVHLAAACVHAPDPGASRALYGDLHRIVSISESVGWTIDRYEIEDSLPDALVSVCQADEATADLVDAWIVERLALGGGSAEALFRSRGAVDGDVKALRTLERELALLRRSRSVAPSGNGRGDCPFWLTPNRDFGGVHSDADRFVLLLESGGGGGLSFRGGKATLGGGGGGRLLLGYGVSDRLTVALGPEMGGAASFPEDEAGGNTAVGTLSAATPLLLRLHDFGSFYDFELAPTLRFTDDEILLPPGMRFSFGFGLTALRAGPLMPYGLLYASYELRPATDTKEAEHTVTVGSRVAIDWDP